MPPFRFVRSIIEKADFFSTTQLLRYSDQPQFKTVTGGLCSLIVVVIVSIMFFNLMISTINRVDITWSSQITKQNNPPPISMNFSNFQIGIELLGINLTDYKKYFDVVLSQIHVNNDHGTDSITYFPLGPCKTEEWNITQDIYRDFNRSGGSSWLCPPSNASFTLEGSYSSDNIRVLQIDIMACNSFYQNQTCANASEVEKILDNTVFFTVYFVNALVDPQNFQPISYYLEDNYYVSITKSLGGNMRIPLSGFQIETDYSITPFDQTQIIRGGLVQDFGQSAMIESRSELLAKIWFQKAKNYYTYSRSFVKIDYVISYVGGLFGAIIGVMFVMNHYTKVSFQIIMGNRMFNGKDNEPLSIKALDFFRYLGYGIYSLFLKFGYKCNWKLMEIYDCCREEIQMHLDIKFLIERVLFLERTLFTLFGEDRMKVLHLRNKCTFQEAKRLREMYYINVKIHQQYLQQKISKCQTNNRINSAALLSKKLTSIVLKKDDNQQIFSNNKWQEKIFEDVFSKKSVNLSPSKPQIEMITLGKNKVYSVESIEDFLSQKNQFNQLSHKHVMLTQQLKKQKTQYRDDKRVSIFQEIRQNEKSQIPSTFEIKYGKEILNSINTVKNQAKQGDIFSNMIWQLIEPQIGVKLKTLKTLQHQQEQKFSQSAVSIIQKNERFK